MRQLLRESFQYIDRSVFAAVDRFAEEQPWVTGYTRFVAFAEYFGAPWIEWPEPIRRGDRAAVEALSSVLWGYTARDSLKILQQFFPDGAAGSIHE